ncbi:MAG: fatty acid desaturase [Chroococcus sp. CMT-3BRIN-NPC107]|jgi:fatty acid desaturase|nr:fatty acid desaturase [Chroococcus sp. CMT-3BRIN-NPC107]
MKSPLLKNISLLVYIYSIYGLGITLLIVDFWLLNILGVILVTHALIFSATLTHELIHGNLFKEHRQLNAFWGQAMTHINGACYATWSNLVGHHFNHHIYHADFVGFDMVNYLNTLNPVIRWIYMVCEWAYVPIFEFELRWRIILAPFLEKPKRPLLWRNVALMLYRTAAFALLGWISLKALLLYALAYISFVNIMRFADAFHHIYDYVIMGQEIPKRDRLYEQKYTFSNLVSVKYPWLNLLFLNFGYHNAHHHNMSYSWHELPQLHQTLYGDTLGGIVPLPILVTNYHKLRLKRLFSGQGEATNITSQSSLERFVGGVAVSFLTPP